MSPSPSVVVKKWVASMDAGSSTVLMKWLARETKHLGISHHVFVVGGAVRNHILQAPVKDVDVVIDTIGAGKDSEWLAKELIKQIPAETNLATNQYGVALLKVIGDWELEGHQMRGIDIEIANARTESYTDGGYTPDNVAPSTIQDDILRRDFTFNSLLWRMYDLADGPDKAPILDLAQCGVQDLKDGVMRCPADPDKTFKDDPSRLIRAVKFLIKYGFKLSPDTKASIIRNRQKLKNVPHAHLSNMLINVFLREPTGKQALLEMDKLGLLDVIKEIAQDSKPFREALANWADREAKVDFLFDLMDLGLPAGKRLVFLTSAQQVQVRSHTVRMTHDEAEGYLAVLAQPGKVLDTRALMVEFNLAGAAFKQLTDVARVSLLEDPDLVANPQGLTQAVREGLAGRRLAAGQWKPTLVDIKKLKTTESLRRPGAVVEFDQPTPPIVVTDTGKLLDGHHRVDSALRQGITKLFAYVVPEADYHPLRSQHGKLPALRMLGVPVPKNFDRQAYSHSKRGAMLSRQAASVAIKTACVIGVGTWEGHVCLVKNRDRNYKPSVKIVHEVINGVEVAYMLDEGTDWSEGMNEFGIGVVNSALMVGRDEAEKKIVKELGKKSKDGARIRAALGNKSLKEVVDGVCSASGGVKGHTFVSSPKKGFSVEQTSRHECVVKDISLATPHVRTNHGYHYGDAGYTDGADYLSSVVRRETADQVLRGEHGVDEIAPALVQRRKEDHKDPNNIVRKTDNMFTSTQMVMDLTGKKLYLYLIPGQVTWVGVENRLPKGREPKIQVEVLKYKGMPQGTPKPVKVKMATMEDVMLLHKKWGEVLARETSQHGKQFEEASQLSRVDPAIAKVMVETGDPGKDKISVSKSTVPASKLKPSQTTMVLEKSIGMALFMLKSGNIGGDLGAIISSDGHIMDGHHRWSAAILAGGSEAKVGGYLAKIPGKDLVRVLNIITKGYFGVAHGNRGSGSLGDYTPAKVRREMEAILEKGLPGSFPWSPQDVADTLTKAFGSVEAGVDRISDNAGLISHQVPSWAPDRADMPVIDPKQVPEAAKVLQEGKVDWRPPYVMGSAHVRASRVAARWLGK